MVAQYVNIQCQNLNWISAQTTGVVYLASNFMKHLVMLFKHDLHRKRNIFRTFAPSTTSGVFMVNGMADGELQKSGGEGIMIGVCPKHFVPWVLTPVMGKFGVMVKGGCHLFFSDQGPLLKGGGDVGGTAPTARRFCGTLMAL